MERNQQNSPDRQSDEDRSGSGKEGSEQLGRQGSEQENERHGTRRQGHEQQGGYGSDRQEEGMTGSPREGQQGGVERERPEESR